MNVVAVAYLILLLFYITLFVFALYRFILIWIRARETIHQLIYFMLISIGALGRFFAFLFFGFFQSFTDSHSRHLDIFNAIVSDFFLSAFLLLLFTLGQVYISVRSFHHLQRHKVIARLLWFFVITNVILYAIHFSIIFNNKDEDNFFLASMYCICAIGLSIFSAWVLKLQKFHTSMRDSAPKKIFITLLISLICYILRIVTLIEANLHQEMGDSTFALIALFYYLICEFLPIIVVIFVLFPVPKIKYKPSLWAEKEPLITEKKEYSVDDFEN
ncbi:tobamovirus multiplication protein 1-like isoform x1 [Anaeramoeba ignava]|uniref:Tobamovirus multiplication protein 1-like isoform x1 n=1 Tax=Anaeramoeba ignava TaxID=1746090 RepID=A0A9Q0RI58_ANAIG|nr:tobamovirus multiplication protein 1-like isoform x1 [Anaeramoeba ignava]